MIRVLKLRQEYVLKVAVLGTTCLAGLLPLGAHAEPTLDVIPVSQPAPQSEDARHKELVDTERAILEGISARAIGAFDNNVAPAKVAKKIAKLKVAVAKADLPVAQEIKPALPVVPTEVKAPEGKMEEPKAAAVVTAPAQSKPRPADPVIAKLSSDNNSLKRDVAIKAERVLALERELELVRGQLASAEVELSRISSINDPRARAALRRYPTTDQGASTTKVETTSVTKSPVAVTEPLPSADLQIATVSVAKADLRVGPGKEHSPLMQVGRGARLAVEARKGEWYRVFAPNGQRAWIHSGLVTFGSSASVADNASAVRVKGFSSSVEDAAFQRIQSMTGGK
jgi:SH3-like domain-containing protein